MNISTLKTYARINRRWLAPSAKDCIQPEDFREYMENINQVVSTERSIHKYVYEFGRQKKQAMRYRDIRFSVYILICLTYFLPFLFLKLDTDHIDISNLRTLLEVDVMDMRGAGGWILYIIPLFFLMLHTYVYQIRRSEPLVAAIISRFILLGICAYFGGYQGVSIYGSTNNWFYILLFGGLLITFIARLIERRRVVPLQKEARQKAEQVEQLEKQIDRAAQLFETLGDGWLEDLRQLCPEIQPAVRKPWFDIERTYNDRNFEFAFPVGNWVETDFIHPFSEKMEEHSSRKEHNIRYVTIHEQDLSFRSITAREATDLLKRGKIVPFFNWALPEFPEGLEYMILRHKWNIDRNSMTQYTHIWTMEVDSAKQRQFDADTYFIESHVLGTTAGVFASMHKDDSDVQHAYLDYKLEKDRIREKLGSDTVEYYAGTSVSERTTHSEGDEIGIMTVCTVDGELLGVYCGDSLQSLAYTHRTLFERSGFELTPTMTCWTETQKAYLYIKLMGYAYIRKF